MVEIGNFQYAPQSVCTVIYRPTLSLSQSHDGHNQQYICPQTIEGDGHQITYVLAAELNRTYVHVTGGGGMRLIFGF